MGNFLSRLFSIGMVASAFVLTVSAQSAPGDAAARAVSRQGRTTLPFSQKTVQVKSGISDIRGFSFLAGRRKPQTVRKSETADLPTIYGSCIYADTWGSGNQPSGFYKLPQSANEDAQMLFSGPMANYGGVCVDGIYYATQYVNVMGMFQYTDVSGYDVETGTKVRSLQAGNDALAKGLDVDPVTGNIYGITYNTDGNALQLTQLEYGETEVTATRIAAINGNWCGFCIDKDGQFYGLRQDLTGTGDDLTVSNTVLCKIDRETGSFTEVGSTGVNSSYLGGFCIDHKTGRMFQTISLEDTSGHLYEIDPESGAATELFQFKDNGEYVGIYVPAPAAPDGAPAVCEDVQILFNNDALAGTVSLTAPATLYDGSQATGDVTIHVLANGEEVAQSVFPYGEQCNLNIDLSTTGSGLYETLWYMPPTRLVTVRSL